VLTYDAKERRSGVFYGDPLLAMSGKKPGLTHLSQPRF